MDRVAQSIKIEYNYPFYKIREDDMKFLKDLPVNVNGFEVIEDKGFYRVIVICKACKNPFETNYYTLNRIKGCGCNRPSKLAPLPEFINGFKTIQCHGYDTKRGVRWATVECKECKRIYECDPNKLQYRKHCGCKKKGVIACKYKKSHPQLAQAISHMMGRCYNKNNQDYYNYGARGITVCDEWLNDRNTFCEWSLENGFENDKGLSIDRIDSSKGYFPENCKWSTPVQQSRNTRRNVLTMDLAQKIRIDSSSMKYWEMAIKYNVSQATIGAVVRNEIWKEK